MNTSIPACCKTRAPLALALLAGSLAAGPALAQTPSGEARDEMVVLPEFEVTSQSQEGYVASETMTGSRIPTGIRDLPYNIDVVTSDFLNDFDILDNSQIFNGGVVTLDQDAGSTYTVRGISPNGELVNGFWLPAGIPLPNVLKARIEVIKGPSAGAYGQTAPGGMLNMVLKQPETTPKQSLRVTLGSYGRHEGTAESTGPLGSRTAYLALVAYDERSFNQPWHENRNRTAAFSIDHKFDATSDLKIDLIAVGQRNHSPVNRVPYLFNSLTGRYYGVAYNLGNISGTGPNSYSNSDNYSAFAVYEKRLNDIFSVRLGSDWYANNSRSFNTTPDTAYDPDPTHAQSNLYSSEFYGLDRDRAAGSSYSAPSYKIDNKDGGGAQGDFLAHYKLFNGAMENKTLLTFDFQSMYEYVVKDQMPQVVKTKNNLPSLNSNGTVATSNAVDPAVFPVTPQFAGDTSYWLPVIDPLGPLTYLNPAGIPTYIYNLPDPGSGQFILSSWQKTRTDDFGTMVRQQTTLWSRLFLYGSIRFDNVMYNAFTLQHPTWSLAAHPQWASYWKSDDVLKNPNPISHYHSDAFTPSAGVSYRVTPGISAYANYSQSFKASTQQVTGATTGSYFLPNERAIGYDYGVKTSWLDGRLNYSLGGFYILQKNMVVTAIDQYGNTFKEAAGTVTSKGVETTLDYDVTRSLFVQAGYYRTNAKWGGTGTDLDLSGRPKAGVPPDIATAAVKYSLGGPLTGVRLMGMYQFTGKTRAEDGGGLTVGKITPVGSNNGLRELYLVGTYTINVGASYEFKTPAFGSKTFRQSVQFNVNNLLNHTYVTYSRSFGDSRTYLVTYTLSF